jgi:murein DD-endopeptidase MepM/ murein hydrolase activator NlpD
VQLTKLKVFLMTEPNRTFKCFPKGHLLAAGSVVAFLGFALAVFPSGEVKAKKNHYSIMPDAGVKPYAGKFEAPASLDSLGDEGIEADTRQDNPLATTQAIEIDSGRRTVTVGKGDTLSTIFNQVGLSPKALNDLLVSSKDARSFTRLKIGQVLEFELDADSTLQRLSSQLSSLESIEVSRTEQGLVFKRNLVKPDIRSVHTYGVIDSSLMAAAKRAGLSHGLTLDLANVFGYDIDFAQDIRKGDSFELIYEEKSIQGKTVGTGSILAARFTNRGKTHTAIRYTNKQGVTNYYGADGSSTRKAFIRTPVDFARISSRFSNGRRHPVLNKIRAHKGVDYAAPRGTPIKAAGDGKVQLAGRHGGYGNTVILQHGNRYKTLYAHMNGFAKGVRKGASVRQGQIIGYVGTTGLSTGPHLHYEFQVNGVHVDPLSQKLPMADPIPASEKQRFLQFSQPLVARLDQEKASLLALNNI